MHILSCDSRNIPLTLSTPPTRQELLDVLETLKTEQRRIDHAIAALEVYLRDQSWPNDLQGIARYESPQAANGNGFGHASAPSRGRKRRPGANPQGTLVQFPILPNRP
jgi:hypothetical protein